MAEQDIEWGEDDGETAPASPPEPTPAPTPPASPPDEPAPVTTDGIPREANAEAVKDPKVARRVSRFGLPTPTSSKAPHWVTLPEGFKPPRNKQVIFLRFRSELTDAPGVGRPMVDEKGDVIMRLDGAGVQLWRECIIWSNNVADRRFALKRSLGDADRGIEECTRQMIRAIDGVMVDWSVAGVHDQFWNELGEKGRTLVQRIYYRLHQPNDDEIVDFLLNCVAVRTASY